MGKVIDIELQRFTFDDSWTVFKTDNETDLSNLKRCVQGTKDADLIGIHQGNRLYLIEVTDLRCHRIENREKLLNGNMIQEFVQKIRDIIPAIVGAYHTTVHKEQWREFMNKLGDRNERIQVILWMEQDDPKNDKELKRRINEMNSFNESLKKHLSWLKPRILVESIKTYDKNLGFEVCNLQGAGQP